MTRLLTRAPGPAAVAGVPELDDDAIRHAALVLEDAAELLGAASRDRSVRANALEEALHCLRAASIALRMAMVSGRDRSAP